MELMERASYCDWCQYYGKDYSEDRLRTFSANFLAVEKYHRETGVSLILNELADMTSEEFQKGRTERKLKTKGSQRYE